MSGSGSGSGSGSPMSDEGVRNTIARMKRAGYFFNRDEVASDSQYVLNMNDCFSWGCADSEDVSDYLRPIAEAYAAHGFVGVLAQVAIKRGYDPDPTHLTEEGWGEGFASKFHAVKAHLQATSPPFGQGT